VREVRGRWVELALLFVVGPLALSFAPRFLVLPAILAGCATCLALLLLDPSFDRAHLWAAPAARRGFPRVLARTAVVWAGLLLLALVVRGRAALFHLPRARPAVWLGVVLLYPIFSVYPQEIMYRTFFFHRYARIFRQPATRIVANALLFGWAHLIVHNMIAVLLATAGGLLFASTYERARSTLLVTVEHALYGDFLFSVGLGGMFVTGVRVVSAIVG